MPPKYHLNTAMVPNRFPTVIRSGVIAWEEGCLKCPQCVKRQCVYGVYDKRGLESRFMSDSLDSLCKDCFRCVQNCPNRLIHKALNPNYKNLGDSYWTPEIISKLWYQAETGRIPVSGAGYGGPFSGPGFDAMWTDMSEIVRPTRDGIHGREYISTQVDLGRKHQALEFDTQGKSSLYSLPFRGNPSADHFRYPALVSAPGPYQSYFAASGQKYRDFYRYCPKRLAPEPEALLKQPDALSDRGSSGV